MSTNESTEQEKPADGEASAVNGVVMQNLYDHGGSRIWLEKEGGRKELLADTYGNAELSVAVKDFLTKYVSERSA